MSIYIIIFFITLGLLFLPLTVRGSVRFDIVSNSGEVSALFYRQSVFRASLSLSHLGVVLDSRKRKVIPFSSITGEGDFKARFFKKLFLSLRYNDVRLLGRIGAGSMASCLSCGVFDILSGSALSLAIDKLNIKNYRYSFLPSFTSFEGAIYVSGSVTFNIAILIYSLVCSVVKN